MGKRQLNRNGSSFSAEVIDFREDEDYYVAPGKGVLAISVVPKQDISLHLESDDGKINIDQDVTAETGEMILLSYFTKAGGRISFTGITSQTTITFYRTL